MSEVHDNAVSLLALPQHGTYLTPEGREVVLRAIEEVSDWQARALTAEAKLAAISAALTLSPAAPSEPGIPLPVKVETAGDSKEQADKKGGGLDLMVAFARNTHATEGTPRAGELVALDDGSHTRAKDREEAPAGERTDLAGSQDRPVAPDGRRGSEEGGPPTPSAAASARTCKAFNKSAGVPCTSAALDGSDYCGRRGHAPKAAPTSSLGKQSLEIP